MEPRNLGENRPKRNMLKVIERMQSAIPDQESAMRSELDYAIRSMSYHAPEQMQGDLGMISVILKSHIGSMSEPFPEWANQVLAIWSGRDVIPEDYSL